MKEKFKLLPKILKKQIIVRGGIGALFLLLFIILIVLTNDFVLSFPCIILAAFLIANSINLLLLSINNKLICIVGECHEIDRSLLTRRQKSMVVTTEQCYVKVPLRKRYRNLKIGTKVNLYVNEKTPIFEDDKIKTLSSYYAIEIKG